MTVLTLGRGVSFPPAAITETFGILAARGAGKSNTAAVMAEEMFATELPFVVIDPVGAWWGLRSSKNGRGPGLGIVLFGGKHGDVPLERAGGSLVADIIVADRLSCVLDLTDFESEAAKKHFLLDFAKRLYTQNEQPLQRFLEEADDYIPQRPQRDEMHLLRAWENIVRRGRARGLGMTMITQRSASINKNVLTQVQTLIAMRTTGPQDRKAIEEWIKYNDQSRDILSTLSALAAGEAWIWSPQFLRCTKRVKFRRRRTFDSGSTPKMAAKSKTAKLADVDVNLLRVRMSETVERAQANDPKLLRQRIAELERTVKSQEKRAPTADPDQLSALKQEVAKLTEHGAELREQVLFADKLIDDVHHALTIAAAELQGALDKCGSTKLVPAPTPKKQPATIVAPAKLNARNHAKKNTAAEVSQPQQRILDALATLANVSLLEPPKNVVATVAGVSPRSSGYTNNLGRLRALGLIDYGPGKTAYLTATGESAANWPDKNLTLAEYHDSWARLLMRPQAAIFEACVAIHPDAIDKQTLADRVGVSASSSGYTNNLGRLRALGLIDYPQPGYVVATDMAFPGDLK